AAGRRPRTARAASSAAARHGGDAMPGSQPRRCRMLVENVTNPTRPCRDSLGFYNVTHMTVSEACDDGPTVGAAGAPDAGGNARRGGMVVLVDPLPGGRG